MGTKSSPLVFDVGVALTKRERVGALMVMHMDLMDTHLMHRYQGGLVEQPPCFGDLEHSSLVTISKLLV